jgi:hypothetical protein
MKQSHDQGKGTVLAVLAAAAREAEELIAAQGDDIDAGVRYEAERRLRLFMTTAGRSDS